MECIPISRCTNFATKIFLIKLIINDICLNFKSIATHFAELSPKNAQKKAQDPRPDAKKLRANFEKKKQTQRKVSIILSHHLRMSLALWTMWNSEKSHEVMNVTVRNRIEKAQTQQQQRNRQNLRAVYAKFCLFFAVVVVCNRNNNEIRTSISNNALFYLVYYVV